MKPAEAQNSSPQTMELKRINRKEENCSWVGRLAGEDFIGRVVSSDETDVWLLTAETTWWTYFLIDFHQFSFLALVA